MKLLEFIFEQPSYVCVYICVCSWGLCMLIDLLLLLPLLVYWGSVYVNLHFIVYHILSVGGGGVPFMLIDLLLLI